jgi:hypothetical protein
MNGIEAIKDRLSNDELARITVLHNGMVGAMRAYNADPTATRLKSMQAAEEAYQEKEQKFIAKYAPAADVSETFKNRKAALSWLREQGYKISQGKFYNDCGAGYPLVARDGSVSKFQVLEYAQRLDVSTRAVAAALEPNRDYEARKIKAEAEIAEMKAEKMRRENDTLWLHAEDAWGQLAALVGALRDAVRHQLYEQAPELVLVAAGEQAKTMALYEAIEGAVDDAFNEVAGVGVVAAEFQKAEDR